MWDDTKQGKYEGLTRYLLAEETNPCTLTFEDIERIIGSSLPKSAREHQAWWANQPRGQSLSWTRAGYRATALSIDEERLTFVRGEIGTDSRPQPDEAEPLSIPEAKERLAKTFGIDPSQIEIIIRA